MWAETVAAFGDPERVWEETVAAFAAGSLAWWPEEPGEPYRLVLSEEERLELRRAWLEAVRPPAGR